MKHLISIIIPVYNVENFISKCIQSILEQTYTNFEAILIDDGSPDNSISIAKELIKDDSRFIILTKENGGQGSARNMGIDHSQGEYLAFIDSDDFVEPSYLEEMYKKILQDNAEICTCDVNIIRNSKTTNSIHNNLPLYIELNDFLLCKNTLTSFPCDKLFKRSIFQTMRFDPNIRTYEDSHLVFRLIHGRHITSVEQPLYNYVQREGSTTNSINPTYIEDKLAVMNTFLSFAAEHYSKEEITPYLTYCYLKTYVYITCVGLARYSNNYQKEISLFKKSLDPQFYNYKNILTMMNKSPKVGIGLFIFKLSPRIFKFIIKQLDKNI